MTLLKASAKVGHTIAELRGNKFEHTINVRRQEVSAAGEAASHAPTAPGARVPGRIRLTDGRLCVWRPDNRWSIVPEETDASDAEARPLAAATPARAASPPECAPAEPAHETDEDGYRQYQGRDYDPNIRLADGTHFVWGKGRTHIPEDWDEEAWRRAQGETGGTGTPTPISEGSNGNFGPANGAGG